MISFIHHAVVPIVEAVAFPSRQVLGGAVVLFCSVSNVDPSTILNYTWTKNGTTLYSGTDPNFIVTSVTDDIIGVALQCTAYNSVGSGYDNTTVSLRHSACLT